MHGHYVATVRKTGDQTRGQGKAKDAKLYEFDDNEPVIEQSESVALDGTAQETAYLLFYIRDDVVDVPTGIQPVVRSTNALRPAPASACKYKGLYNQHDTCYLNALLQVFVGSFVFLFAKHFKQI